MGGQVSGAESWGDPQIPESTIWAHPIPGRYQTLRPRARTLSPLAVKPLLLAAAPLSLQMKGQELPAPSAFRGRLNGSWKADLKHHHQAKDGCYVVLLGPKGLRVPGAPGLHFPEFRGEIFAVQPYYTCSMRAYWRRKWQHIPVFLTGKPHGWRSLVGYSPWSRRVGHDTERLHFMRIYTELWTTHPRIQRECLWALHTTALLDYTSREGPSGKPSKRHPLMRKWSLPLVFTSLNPKGLRQMSCHSTASALEQAYTLKEEALWTCSRA